MIFIQIVFLLQYTLLVKSFENDLVISLKLLFKEINNPLQLTAIVCWSVDTSVEFVNEFSNSTTNYQINIVHDELNEFDHIQDTHQIMYIVDVRCPNVGKVINQTTHQFTVNFQMVVVDSEMNQNMTKTNSMDDLMLSLFRDSPILANTQIYFVTKDDNDNFIFRQSKQIQKISVEILTPSKVYRTAVNQPLLIETFNVNSLKDVNQLTSISRRRNFHGVEFRASMVVTNNDTIYHLNDYHNKHIDTITKVCFILTNHLISYLNATITYSIVPSWGYLDTNGEWSGMIGQLVRKEADLGATSLFFTADRVQVIQYIAMPSSTGSAFIFRSPKLSYTNNVFLLPFDDFVWLCLGALVLVTALSLMVAIVIEWKIPNGLCNETDSGLLQPRFSDVFLLIFGATCQQGSAVTPRSNSARIITIIAFIILMFLYTSYAANIVALLQSPSTKIKTLNDLFNSRLKFGVDDTVFNHYYFSHATEPIRKKIYEQKVKNKDGSENFMSLVTGIENIRKGLFAFHTESGVGYKVISETFYEDEKCGLKEIKYLEVIDPWYAIQKNSSYMDFFKSGLMRINEHGLQERENSRLYTSKPKCAGNGGHFVTASLVDTKPAMLVLIYGYVIATILLIIEILLNSINVNRLRHVFGESN